MTTHGPGERGQVLVLTALFLVVLLVAAALTIDYGSWLSTKRNFQSVADAAALAGTAKLPPIATAAATNADRDAAAAEALVYLNDHFAWGHDRTWAEAAVAAGARNNRKPLVVTSGTDTYCVWVWTPTPTSSDTSQSAPGSAPCLPSPGGSIYSGNFQGQGTKVFVGVSSPRSSYFAGVAGIGSEVVSTVAVAGGSHTNYAVIALKPRLGNPDTQLGIKIVGGSTLNVPVGDVGGNYSLDFGGSNAKIVFPDPALDQAVLVEEPGTISWSSGSVQVGTQLCQPPDTTGPLCPQQLEDYPIPDPGYFAPTPSYCSGSPLSQQCQEPAASGTQDWPGLGALAAAYPGCSASDINKGNITCLPAGNATLYPGKYNNVVVPIGTNLTLSPTCYPADTDCIAKGRGGVFYFRHSQPGGQSGLSVSNGGNVSGCGVLLIFDPDESGSALQFKAAGSNTTVNLNGGPGCTMHYDPRHPGSGTDFKWYGFNQPYTNPVSMWVRPNRNGYDLTSTNNGSNVITFDGNATVNENGAIYAPEDNTKISGGGGGSGVGQIVSWTITYTGGTTINETYQGPGILRTRLLE